LGKRGRLRECKGSDSKIQEENECRSKITGEVGYSRRKKLQKKRVIRKLYDKNVV